MNILLHTQGFDLTPAIEAHARKQLHLHLANFSSYIVSIDVFLRDINGPKGGTDMKVLIRANLETRNTVTVENTRADLYDAISIATRQTKRAVRRSVSKHRRMEKFALRKLNRLPQI
jgi:ribosome-associated translation inhibitor RaiA